MGQTGMVRGSDYRRMLRIIGELGDLPADPQQRRTHALTALSDLLGACAGFFSETGVTAHRYTFTRPVTTGLECLGDTLAAYLGGELPLDPCGFAMEARPPVRSDAATRRELIPDAAWYRAAHYEGLRSPAHLDDAVYARLHQAPTGRNIGLCLIRPAGDRPFTPRHREILRAFNDAALPLYLASTPPDPLDGLAPRLRRVAECLLRGLTIKDAAAELGLSPATVMDYTKPLYRAMNVRSQSELLARVLPARRSNN